MPVGTQIKAETCNSRTNRSFQTEGPASTLGGTSISEGKPEVLDGCYRHKRGSHVSAEGFHKGPVSFGLMWEAASSADLRDPEAEYKRIRSIM